MGDTTDDNNPWRSQPHHEDLVHFRTHSLWASVSGPVRKPNDPLVVFITGSGGPCAIYVKLRQKLSSFARVLFYDRAGYDKSTLPLIKENSDGRILAEDTADDLNALLEVTKLEPPYVLVSHSYGGIIAREFLESRRHRPDTIAGMVLLDAATELMLQLCKRVPPLELEAIAKNVDWNKLTDLKRQSRMTDEEWKYAGEAVERCSEAQKREDTHTSARRLAASYQLDDQTLGTRPLSVVRFNMAMDYRLMYEAGVKNGDGTPKERQTALGFIETFDMFQDQLLRAQCRLSKDATFTSYKQYGHDLPTRIPGIPAMEIRELLDRIKEKDAKTCVGN